MLKRTLAIILLGAISVGSAIAEPNQHPMQRFKYAMQQLDLSFSQKQDIRAVMRTSREDMRLYREDMRLVRNQIGDLVTSESYSPEAVAAVVQDNKNLFSAMGWQRYSTMQQVKAVLDESQQAKLIDIMSKPKQRDANKREQRKARFLQGLGVDAEAQPEIVAAWEQVMATRKALHQFKRSLATQVQPDMQDSQWQALFESTYPDLQQAIVAKANAHYEFWQLLDEQQQEKWQQFKQKRAAKFI